MEILKRAKQFQSGEGVPWNADPKDVQQEVNHRAWKAGHADRDGQPIIRRPGAGKGDRYRSIDKQKYDEGYERIDWND